MKKQEIIQESANLTMSIQGMTEVIRDDVTNSIVIIDD